MVDTALSNFHPLPLTCKQCSTTVKDDELLPTNIVQGYSAPGRIRLFTSPLIIASKHPVCESWDLKRITSLLGSLLGRLLGGSLLGRLLGGSWTERRIALVRTSCALH